MTTVSKIGSADFAQILAATRHAATLGAPGPLSTGEALTAALVLNRPDWLIAMKYTIAEALERIGPEWGPLIPAAAKQFKQESEAAEYEVALKKHQAQLSKFTARADAEDETLEFYAKLITSGSAPRYRDVYLTFDLVPMGDGPRPTLRTRLNISPEGGESVVHEIADVHRFAWRKGAPIDAKPDEQRPGWIDGRGQVT
jgi:hypothetical protein